MIKKILLVASIALPLFAMAQFSESFENDLELPNRDKTLPEGWTTIDNANPNQKWEVIKGTSLNNFTGHTGEQFVEIKQETIIFSDEEPIPGDDYLITPAITVTEGVSDYFSFWAINRVKAESISLKISTSTADSAENFNITLDEKVSPAVAKGFQLYQYNLSDYIGQTIYIAFHSVAPNAILQLDDVAVGSLPLCTTPVGPEAKNIKENTADLSWQSVKPGATFEVDYGFRGLDVGLGEKITEITSTTITLTNLKKETKYRFYVRQSCEADFTEWVGPFDFSTICDLPDGLQTPYVESFDNLVKPNCWTIVENPASTSDLNWRFVSKNSTAEPKSGAGMAQLLASGFGGTLELVTPPLNLSELPNPELKLSYLQPQNGSNLTVLYKTTADSKWTELAYYEADAENIIGWQDVTLALPNTSATYYIALKASAYFGASVNVDEFIVKDKDAVLSTTAFDKTKLSYYPNPVTNTLNLSYTEAISTIEVYNLLGQQVLKQQVNATATSLNTSTLTAGTYLVKVHVNDTVETIKVVKK